ncbi:hypothetical protein LGH70_03390 [Hymenobacter sp. BT635]|uniref:Lipoprotein n=1 Tax=Hymenobacter nitidus TaxID=2880929 RepID=A0ABS8AB29_9BACT|nr:hypothetical protein [Hymenobacter nitidus]MCB2376609.1 hypothetical protein [Hymenobacter nitidus]
MKLFTRSLLFAVLLAPVGGLTACSDKAKEEPAPADPTPTYTMGHSFYYPATNTSDGLVHPSRDIKGEARLFSQVLAFDFDARPDAPHFEIERVQLKSGWVGAYALRCRPRPTDPVFASYSYWRKDNSGVRIFRFSDFSLELAGHVTITAYDAKRQLVSGSFEIKAPGENDPLSVSIGQKCDILIFGEFTDMKVKAQQ